MVIQTPNFTEFEEFAVSPHGADLLKKNRNCPRTAQWAQLMEVCLQLIANLIYKCNVNRERFIELQGNVSSSALAMLLFIAFDTFQTD